MVYYIHYTHKTIYYKLKRDIFILYTQLQNNILYPQNEHYTYETVDYIFKINTCISSYDFWKVPYLFMYYVTVQTQQPNIYCLLWTHYQSRFCYQALQPKMYLFSWESSWLINKFWNSLANDVGCYILPLLWTRYHIFCFPFQALIKVAPINRFAIVILKNKEKIIYVS